MSGFSNKEVARAAGRKGKPTKHTKTKQWEALGEFITQEGAERFAEIMQTSDNDTFMDMYLKALNYFKPKISYSINEDRGEKQLTALIIKRIEPNSDNKPT